MANDTKRTQHEVRQKILQTKAVLLKLVPGMNESDKRVAKSILDDFDGLLSHLDCQFCGNSGWSHSYEGETTCIICNTK